MSIGKTNTPKNLLLDVNVCVDILTNRNTDYNVKEFIKKLINNNAKLFYASLSLDTLYYIISRYTNNDTAMFGVLKLLNYVNLIHLSDIDVIYALNSNFKDFEDSLINACAYNNNINIIITRNKKDFNTSDLQIFTPLEYLKT